MIRAEKYPYFFIVEHIGNLQASLAVIFLARLRGPDVPILRSDEDALSRAIITLASQYAPCGYRRITALLQQAGWQVSKDRVERIWRREGLKPPQRQRPRRRLWLNDGSCVRLRPVRANQVWSYDFVSASTHDGRTLRLLTLIDE